MEPRFFTSEQLKQFDGKAGKPDYLAINHRVYDVSSSQLWLDGDHQETHIAGSDLTEDMVNAPHGDEVLARFPIMGELH